MRVFHRILFGSGLTGIELITLLREPLKWPHFCRQLEGRFSLDSGSFMVSGFPA